MPEQRRPYVVGSSIVVALPKAVREHLGVSPGQEVYWHLVRGKEAVLAMTAERKGGHPEGLKLQKELAAARKQIERLGRKAYARPEKATNLGIAHGWTMAMRHNRETFDLVKWLEGRFDDLAARIPFRRRPGRPARSGATVPSPEVERVQAPVLEAQ